MHSFLMWSIVAEERKIHIFADLFRFGTAKPKIGQFDSVHYKVSK